MKTLARATLLMLSCSLSGCFWAALGGAGAETGYVAGQDDRKAGQTMSDQWIFTKVKTQLLAAPGVPSGKIDVTVRKRVVTLTGVVASATERDKAIAAAKSVDGVKKVVDKLFISP